MRRTVERGLAKSFEKVRLYRWGEVSQLMQTPREPTNVITKSQLSVIDNLKKFASMNGFCSLSANQIYQRYRVFVCLKKQLLIPQRWDNYEKVKPDDY